jgi:hypothetical protein
MAAYTSAGTTLRITATAPATFNSAGYGTIFPNTPAAGNPVVGEITDLGEFGREYALVTHNPVGNRSTQKFKGSFNEGSMTLNLALDTQDAGQILMKAASQSDSDYYFEVKTQNGDKYYFPAKVMSWKVGVGSVDQITTATATLEISTSSSGVGVVEVIAV